MSSEDIGVLFLMLGIGAAAAGFILGTAWVIDLWFGTGDES